MHEHTQLESQNLCSDQCYSTLTIKRKVQLDFFK